jgi:hypothetical protein
MDTNHLLGAFLPEVKDMYHNEFLKEYAALNEATLSEERVNETQPDVVTPPDFLFWSPCWLCRRLGSSLFYAVKNWE